MASAWVGNTKHIPEGVLDRREVTLCSSPDALSRSAVLVIDVQNYCSVPDYGCWAGVGRADNPYFFDRVDSMTDNIKMLLSAARANGKTERVYTVIESLTRDGRDISIDYKLSRNSKTGDCLHVPKGGDGAKVLPAIAPDEAANDIVIPKTSCSVFQSTNINYVLRNLNVQHLVVCGQLTHQCVESAVRDAADLGYFVSVVDDACAAPSPEDHASGLRNMAAFARVLSTADVLAELRGEAKGAAVPAVPAPVPQPAVQPAAPACDALAEAERKGHAAAIRTALLAAGVRWVRFATCDNSNRVRGKAINLREASLAASPQRLLEGVGFIRSLNGMINYQCGMAAATGLTSARLDRLVGDFDTLTVLPYNPTHAVVYGSLVGPDRRPTPLCPREFLRRQLRAAADAGAYVSCGVEFEFVLLNQHDNSPVDTGFNYCFASSRAMDTPAGAFLDDLVEALEKQPNICCPVELAHREGGTSQYEVVLRYTDDPLKLADSIVTVRETLHAIGRKHSFIVALLPKVDAALGNGMHIHFSCSKRRGGASALPCADGRYGMSSFGESFIAGILESLDALQGVTMASTNSYRRMQKGYWSGSLKNWGFDDKEASIRVCRDESRMVPEHFEVKTCDATMNPYLALGCIIHCATRGVKLGSRLPPPDEGVPLCDDFPAALGKFKEFFLADSAPQGVDAELFAANYEGLRVYHAVCEDEARSAADLTLEQEVAKYMTFY